MRFDLTLQR